jgi:hypothetical protein
MRADDDRHLERLAPLLGAALVIPEMPAAVKARAEAVRAAELHAMEAGVAHAGLGIARDDDAVGDVGPGILAEVADDRQRAEVDVLARRHDVLHRSRVAREGRDATVTASHPLVGEALERHAERLREPHAVGEEARDQREARAADTVEPEHGDTGRAARAP